MKQAAKVWWNVASVLGSVAVVACATKVDVLEEGKDESAIQWADCQPTELEVRALTGDTCGFSPEGCGDLCASCYVEYECSTRGFACDASGVLRVTETMALGCTLGSVPYPLADPNASWSDCMQALENGSSGDSCVGTWTCARPVQDPCCIEVAECSNYTETGGEGRELRHYRVCSDGCGAVNPRPELPGPSSCADGETGPLEAGIPCTGEYICAGRQDISRAPYVPASDEVPNTLRWCANGVVQAVTDFGTHGL